MTQHNPFADGKIVENYEAWYQTAGRRAGEQEKALLKGLLSNFQTAQSNMEVNCGH
jgi:hypothetical protein